MQIPQTRGTRREFIAASGATAGLLGFASSAGAADAPAAVEINALQPTGQQLKQFMALPDEGPIVMVNLLKFKPDGGAQEYAKYSAAVRPLLEKLDAKILFAGRAEFCLIGEADWDMIALVQYPRKKALMQMVTSPEYQAIHHHRAKGLAGQVNYAVIPEKFPTASS